MKVYKPEYNLKKITNGRDEMGLIGKEFRHVFRFQILLHR